MSAIKAVSLRDVARAAKVSIATVSNYLNNSKIVRPETRLVIEQAIKTLDYRRNDVASSLRRARTYTFGIVIPNVSNPFYTSLFEGAEAEAHANGHMLMLGVTHYDGVALRGYLQSFRNRRVDGIIVDAFNSDCGQDILESMIAPVVIIEPPAAIDRHSTIRIDNFAAGKEASDYLIGKGIVKLQL